MNDDAAPDWREKIERRVSDLEFSSTNQRELIDAIVDGRVGPLNGRVRRTEDLSAWLAFLLDVLAGTIVLGVVVGALLWYLVANPWPVTIMIPPPHSTQLPKEAP